MLMSQARRSISGALLAVVGRVIAIGRRLGARTGLGASNNYAAPLIGRQLLSLEKKDFSWFFAFGPGVTLTTESPWRLLDQGRIVVSSEDHGHQFGLPAPVDAGLRVLSRAAGRTVEAASVASDSGDLILQFSGHVFLELLQLSSGYESWRLLVNGSESICMGGGSIEHFPGIGLLPKRAAG